MFFATKIPKSGRKKEAAFAILFFDFLLGGFLFELCPVSDDSSAPERTAADVKFSAAASMSVLPPAGIFLPPSVVSSGVRKISTSLPKEKACRSLNCFVAGGRAGAKSSEMKLR